MTFESGRVGFQSVSPGRRWSREDRIEDRFSVCGIEWKTVRGESSWFKYTSDIEERARRYLVWLHGIIIIITNMINVT